MWYSIYMATKPKRRRGRPAGPPNERRSAWLRVRLTADELEAVREAVREAAGDDGVSAWVRPIILGATKCRIDKCKTD